MSSRIQVLDTHTANRIAAGEVVERPASVVKELVENSIDAGAKQIEIEIEHGGLSSIVVRDDGIGMSPEDVMNAFKRHATSKIRQAEDLLDIRTLGFRGEALPSIAAVSKVEVFTREPRALVGTAIRLEAGEIVAADDTGCPIGTQVIVTDLFYNTPARLKHQKSEATETARVLETVFHLALAHPEIAFRLSVDHGTRFSTSGNGQLADVIISQYGLDYFRRMIPLAPDPIPLPEGELLVDGYLGSNQLARANRQHQVFIVNGRSIQSDLLRQVLEQSYETLVPLHRYPVGILRLQLPPSRLDVNIHPNKQQVRFNDEELIRRGLAQSLRSVLSSAVLVPEAKLFVERTEKRAAPLRTEWQQLPLREKHDSYGTTEVGRVVLPHVQVPAREKQQVSQFDTQIPPWAELRPVGQVLQSYIVCEGPEGLYLIDQHAAHERVYYEKYLQMSEDAHARQLLAVPIQLELSPVEWQFWKLNRSTIEGLGFVAEDFGDCILLLREVPVLFASFRQKDHASLFRDVLDQWVADGRKSGKPRLEINRARVILASCKAAVKAHDRLSLPEMKALIQQMAELRAPYTCPHGRPTVFRLTEYELAKYFKRVL